MTTVMNAVPESESGLASGINNAVSRLAALLAVAVFGAVLVTVFNHSLDQYLNQLLLTPAVRAQINDARPLLAAAHNPDPMVQHAIAESFVSGYRFVIWPGDRPGSFECYHRMAAHRVRHTCVCKTGVAPKTPSVLLPCSSAKPLKEPDKLAVAI
ncbi:hypothetical protein GOB94_04105 [Granulicella sp. 5B5]|uniref:hypothetical protein n=1 Tax=Granulicella sp. 5B5 TaxID=1617967 RepID=UPI0015F3BCB1|nr:hypothetical protein [Granulicella sp. 5B5]QMV17964.1 hypothetical protein GOB94_04105 [Granulicella sp. 5B5]